MSKCKNCDYDGTQGWLLSYPVKCPNCREAQEEKEYEGFKEPCERCSEKKCSYCRMCHNAECKFSEEKLLQCLYQ